MGANIREGGVNGTTNSDRTNYFATVPSANLETLLWVESRPAGDAARPDRPEEARQPARRRQERAPPGLRGPALRPRLRAARHQNFAPAGHPYSWTVIGSMEDLTRRVARRRQGVLPPLLHAEQPVARDCRRLRSGRGEAAGREVLRRPAARTGAGSAAALDARSSRASGSSRSPIACPRRARYIAYVAPEYFGADEAAMQITARILGDGLSSRLEKALIYDKPLASEVNVGFDAAGDRRRLRRSSATARDGVALAGHREGDHAGAAPAGAGPARPRPSSIAPAPSWSSSSSRGSSASAASAARPIC